MQLFVDYTGESNKPLPPRGRLEAFRNLLDRLKGLYGGRLDRETMEAFHQERLARIERIYARQEKENRQNR